MHIIRRFGSALRLLKNAGIKSVIQLTWIRILERMPLINAIVFECESDMDDNPRAFYEYLIEQRYNRKFRMVWLVNDVAFCKEKHQERNVVFLNRHDCSFLNQLRLNYYLYSAKWFIFSHPYWFYKHKSEQVVVHVAHGTPIKQGSKSHIEKCFDWLLVPTDNVIDWYTRFLHCSEEKTFICGLPRNDLLWKGAKKKREIIVQLIPEYAGERIIMCMPTFRQSTHMQDSEVVDCFGLSVVESDEQFKQLNDYLKEQHIHLIVKPHPLQRMEYIRISEASNIHYFQNKDLLYKDIMLYELLGCSDALLTDVSSVVFDYLLLNRPVGFFMNNFETYTRGYLLDDPTEYMPGAYMYSFDDLMRFIQNFSQGQDDYQNERIRVCKYVNGNIDAKQNSCQSLAEWLW